MRTDRIATEDDIPAIRDLMDAAISELQRGFLTPAQIAASRAVMGLDTRIIADRTYFLVFDGETLIGGGGWGMRGTLFGGDHSAPQRDDRLLDPATEPARIRAMYTHPGFARCGVGRHILRLCEAAASAKGFARAELMATLPGEPLYRAAGYEAIERVTAEADGIAVPLVRMEKSLQNTMLAHHKHRPS